MLFGLFALEARLSARIKFASDRRSASDFDLMSSCHARARAQHRARSLIRHIVRAQRVTVTQQEALPFAFDETRIVDQFEAAPLREVCTDQKVPIAVHQANAASSTGVKQLGSECAGEL